MMFNDKSNKKMMVQEVIKVMFDWEKVRIGRKLEWQGH